MKIEKELARGAGKSFIFLLTALILVGVFIYLGLNLTETPMETKSVYHIDSIAAQTGRQTTESHEYQALLEKYNRTESKKAREEGQSFVARIREGTGERQPLSQKSPENEDLLLPPPVTEHETALSLTSSHEHRQKAIDALLKELNTQWQPVAFQSAPVIEGAPPRRESKKASLENRPISLPSTAPLEKEIVAPYTRLPAIIETAVDSDHPESQVLASIPTGRYAGATLHAKRVQLAGDGISIRFDRMSWQGHTYAVEAYALDEKTLQSSVASQVHHRYFSRIILPAVAMGLGRAGQLFEQSNTQNTITSQGTVLQTRPSTPEGKVIAGTMVGGMGKQAAQVMTQDAARLPLQQAVIHRGQIVAIQFMGGVYDKDRLS